MTQSLLRRALVVIATTVIAGSQLTSGRIEQGPTVATEHRVDPSMTGAQIRNATGQHFAIAPAAGIRTERLLVFLPGSGGRPDFYRSFLRHAAERGHFAIGLAYENAAAVNKLCASAPSPTSQEEERTEIITGAARSPLLIVDAPNSIDNRVRALLAWLDRSFAEEGWGRFLANGEPRWDRVIVAGHSQGGGHAAMIARLRVVDRAILFSATEPARWTTATFATPKSRLYGFAHQRESAYRAFSTSWRLIGMAGPLTTVDAASPPFGGAHQLQTSVDTCRSVAIVDRFHNCVITDAVTPRTPNGQPVFAPVWTFLLEQ
jgi:pimeloyl-ACP methyl ester carboxylesterase